MSLVGRCGENQRSDEFLATRPLAARLCNLGEAGQPLADRVAERQADAVLVQVAECCVRPNSPLRHARPTQYSLAHMFITC